jgi:NRAMP (natural resistance-associated macrophage protein)-like metal ion transporter
MDSEAGSETPPPKTGILSILGPGLITGASDDDPSGIATYSQVGAQFGYAMAWTMPFSFPLMAAIQEISARIGRVTGVGIAGNIRLHFPRWLLWAVIALLSIANVFNLAADLCAMGDALRLLAGGRDHAYVVVFGVTSSVLQVFMSYRRYVSILKWTTLALFAYVATVLVVHVPWQHVAAQTIFPSIPLTNEAMVAVVAVLGTTISPYLFFWQSSQEAEDQRVRPDAQPLVAAPVQARRELARIRIDTYLGMFFSNLIGFFIIVTAAATLNVNGVLDIRTSGEAAEALRPIAGSFAFVVFAAGIVGTGLLAVPVLAGSVGYAVGEALGRPVGLARLPGQAKVFYGLIAVATIVGVGLNFSGIDPIKALYWSAVLNGIVAVPLMVVMMLMTARPRIMGRFTLPRPLAIVGWLATLVMAVTVLGMFASLLV